MTCIINMERSKITGKQCWNVDFITKVSKNQVL